MDKVTILSRNLELTNCNKINISNDKIKYHVYGCHCNIKESWKAHTIFILKMEAIMCFWASRFKYAELISG